MKDDDAPPDNPEPFGGENQYSMEPPQIAPIIEPKKPSLWRGLRNSFFAGVVVAAPITITAWLVINFVGFVDRNVVPLVPERFNPETYLPFSVPGFGLIVAFIFLTILGAAARNLFGRALLKFGEGFVDRMPVVRNLYKGLKQIFETVLAQSETTFQEVALIEYPRKGLHALAFVTTRARGEIQDRTDGDMVAVFVPTTPNPTSGFLLFVDRRELKIMDMTVEDAAKLIISGGLVTPDKEEPEPITDVRRRSRGLLALFTRSQPERKKRRKARSRSKR